MCQEHHPTIAVNSILHESRKVICRLDAVLSTRHGRRNLGPVTRTIFTHHIARDLCPAGIANSTRNIVLQNLPLIGNIAVRVSKGYASVFLLDLFVNMAL